MRGHVTKRASGRWAIVLDIGRDPVTDRRKQKWVSGFATKAAAEDELTELLGKRKRGELIDPDMTPLHEYLTSWLDGRVAELAPLSVVQYRGIIRNHVKPAAIGAMPLGKIRRSHVRAFETILRDKGLGASTRNVVFAVVSRALADAVEDDLLSASPCAAGRARGDGKREPKRFTVWTPSELRDLLTAVEEDRLSALWRVAVATGCRRGELLGLNWLGVSFEKRTIEVSQQVVPTRGGHTIHPCKTKGSHRTIRIDDETVAALERHRDAQVAEKELAGDAYDDRDLVFANEIGQPINPQRLTDAFGAHRKVAGIRPGRLHDVRHTHATHLLTGGVPVHVVASRLGHSSPVVTMTTYAHVLPRSDEQAADVIAAVLG